MSLFILYSICATYLTLSRHIARDEFFMLCIKNSSRAHSATPPFWRLLKKNGLPKIRFYDLRHMAGSLPLASGATVKQVQEFLGHEQASTTMDIYAHTDAKSRRETAHIIETTLKIQAC